MSKFLDVPACSVSDSTTQTINGADTNAYAITFNTDEYKWKMTHSTVTNPSRITVDIAGTYLISFSAIGEVETAAKHIDIWLAVDGSPVARTNTITEFTTAGNERLITVLYIYTFTAGQYFELYWCSDIGAGKADNLKATGTQSNPTRPACPSVILTANKISK